VKILLIDAIHSFVDFALRCEAAGHEVRVFMGPAPKGNPHHCAGDGMIHKVKSWQPHMDWADLIVLSDNTKYLPELEGYRNRGYPIFGANLAVAKWELDRDCGVKILDSHGITTIPSILFKKFQEGIDHLLQNPGKRYVCKPLGDADRALSYVSKSSRDLLFMLQEWKRTQKPNSFLFQEFIPGIEMAVGGWMGRNGFSSYVLENFEFKKLMPGDIGVNTGEMGTVMKYCRQEDSLLAQRVLLPLEAELIRSGYTGYIDVAVMIDKKGNPWPLEFTSRPGWPLFQIQQILHPDPAQWMLDLLQGRDSFSPYCDVAAGVVLAVPDFPYNERNRDECCGFPVWGITDKNRYFLHPCEMQMGEAPELEGGKLKQSPIMVSAGSYMMVASGCGETVADAAACAYATVKSLEMANSPIYRNDIGGRLEEQLPELQAMGYATSWSS